MVGVVVVVVILCTLRQHIDWFLFFCVCCRPGQPWREVKGCAIKYRLQPKPHLHVGGNLVMFWWCLCARCRWWWTWLCIRAVCAYRMWRVVNSSGFYAVLLCQQVVWWSVLAEANMCIGKMCIVCHKQHKNNNITCHRGRVLFRIMIVFIFDVGS